MRFKLISRELENKVRFFSIPVPATESAVAIVLVKTGSRNETDSQLGISHILEHMVFKGTEKYPTPQILASAVDSMGAEFNAFTGKEHTGFYIKSAAEYLSTSLEILADMILRPKLRQEDLDREKGVIIEEIKMYADQPRERVMEEFENLIFQGSNLGRLIIGSPTTVQQTNSPDLKSYMSEWYKGANILVLVVGKVDSQASFAKFKQLFSSARAGVLKPYADQGHFGRKKELIINKKTEQTHFVVGVPGLSADDPRRHIEAVLRVALGGNMSSRLFVEVREKRGLAYYVGSIAEHFYDTGYIGARAGVKKDKFNQALEVVKDQMLNLTDRLTQEEINRAKKYILGKTILSLEDSMGIVNWFANRLVLGLPAEQPQTILAKTKQVKLEEVKKLASDLFQADKIRLAVIK